MLKWNDDNGLKSKSLRVTVRTTAGISGYDATPADLIQALKANPEACKEVSDALLIQWRASAAEYRIQRDKATDRATAAERVVEAARVIRLGRSRLPAVGPDAPGVVTVAWIEGLHKLEDALRAYDAAQAKDSGGASGAAEQPNDPGPGREVGHRDAPASHTKPLARDDSTRAEASVPASGIPSSVEPPEPAGGSTDSPVGVAATAMGGHEAPAQNRQPVEPPSDPATGTTRREPPETDRQDGSTGAVARLCGEWCREESATCRRRKGHDGPHTSALNDARRLDSIVTPADLDALEERIVERVARACDAAQDAPRDWGKPEPGSLDCLADELRRKP